MDTTEPYVKMCEKAVEIQELAPNFVINYRRDELHIDLSGNWWFLKRGKAIWLPCQDQLQEMVDSAIAGQIHLMDAFMHDEQYHGYDLMMPEEMFTSWEQLWLALVMLQKHGKIWNGEDWVGGTEVVRIKKPVE